MITSLESWRAYASSGGEGIIDQALIDVPLRPSVAEVAALRRAWPEGVVAVAIEAARARHRASGKLHPALVERLIADEQGVMVASSSLAATYKAHRFAALAADTAFDLCCGIGADAYELARAGVSVTAVDLDPVRAWMASVNARCEAVVEDVASTKVLERIHGAIVHLDPSRRDGGRRTHRYEDYQPGPENIEKVIEAAGGACIKLGPGVDFAQLPSPTGSFVELLSEHGRLTQALLWTGTLAQTAAMHEGHRMATLLPRGERFVAEPGPLVDADRWDDAGAHARPVLEYVYEADPSLERAHLLGPFAEQHELRPIHPAVGVLTGAGVIESPWLTRFCVLEVMPWRSKVVKARLRELDGGIVVVKTRGKAVDPDALQKKLRGQGEHELTLFVLRLGEKATAIITRREPDRV